MKWISSILLVIYFFAATAVQAAVTVTDVDNASNFDDDSSLTVPIIYGGSAGNATSGDCASASAGSTCNNCDGTSVACNPTRIHQNLLLVIYFKAESGDYDGTARALLKDADGNTISLFDNSSSVTAGSTGYVEVYWSEICEAMNGADGTCETDDTENFTVGFDTGTDGSFEASTEVQIIVNNTSEDTIDGTSGQQGIDSISFFPGDEKAVAQDVGAVNGSTFPNIGETTWEFMRVAYSEVSFNTLTPEFIIDSGQYRDLKIDTGEDVGTADLETSVVDGLTNGVIYHFRIALVDKAKNMGAFTAESLYQATGECGADGDTTITDVNDAFTCPYAAQPEEVFGLLTEDIECFITTAAYGSTFASKVEDFRHFRSQYMLPSPLGRQLNKLYNIVGAPIAKVIHKSDFLKSLSRVLLYPFWLFASASLQYGLTKILFAIFATLITLILSAVLLRRKFSST